jgi:hypothetical protein
MCEKLGMRPVPLQRLHTGLEVTAMVFCRVGLGGGEASKSASSQSTFDSVIMAALPRRSPSASSPGVYSAHDQHDQLWRVLSVLLRSSRRGFSGRPAVYAVGHGQVLVLVRWCSCGEVERVHLFGINVEPAFRPTLGVQCRGPGLPDAGAQRFVLQSSLNE